jgi:excinuclease ABC subunit A
MIGGMIVNGAVSTESIIIKNATTHNLKNVSVAIPLNRFTCVTGVSGGGKSSLVYDTLYAESQRAFLESMASNAFGEKLMDKPPVDSIENLRPALRLSQQYYNRNPRSTIGTLSGISHYLRSLFALITNEESGTKLTESFFSPNDAAGCCPMCNGLGEVYVVDMTALIPDTDVALACGGIRWYAGKHTSIEYKTLEWLCEHFSIDINKKVCELSERELYELLYRKEDISMPLRYKSPKGRSKQKVRQVKGAVVELQEQLRNINMPSVLASIGKYLKMDTCRICNGSRLGPEVLEHRINGLNIAQIEHMQLLDLIKWAADTSKSYCGSGIGSLVDSLTKQIMNKAKPISDLSLDYLSVDRKVPRMSSGELQRLRIGIQLSCSLSGLMYILDEPCKGLHARNVDSLILATSSLVRKGNTVIAIEHNKQYASKADCIIELGPVGGPNGGYITSNGATGLMPKYIEFKQTNDKKRENIELKKVNFHNIKNQNVTIPTGDITCITGVSGSGKSSLIQVLRECFDAKRPVHCVSWDHPTETAKAVYVNQQPIGKTPRSTVLSFLELSTPIRILFANTVLAKEMNLKATDFSLNVPGGRCETCQGSGLKRIELNYLPDTYVTCPDCGGKRFTDSVLAVTYRDKIFSEILDSPIESILDAFSDDEVITNKLQCLSEIGLGYLSLGQMSMNLSGGEAQRIKLAKALTEAGRKKIVYLLDEPTSGLHSFDIERLVPIMKRICDNGNTIIMIEHNIEFIASIANYMIDFGIYAGSSGGKIVACGNPQTVCLDSNSSWYGVL